MNNPINFFPNQGHFNNNINYTNSYLNNENNLSQGGFPNENFGINTNFNEMNFAPNNNGYNYFNQQPQVIRGNNIDENKLGNSSDQENQMFSSINNIRNPVKKINGQQNNPDLNKNISNKTKNMDKSHINFDNNPIDYDDEEEEKNI